MNGKSCFFIGHRKTSDQIYPALQAAVEKHITSFGVTEFIVGHYGNFDFLAAKAVIAAKQSHPNITLSLLLPYHPAECPIQKPEGFDSTYYPQGMEKVPRRAAIVRANHFVVDHSDYLIAHAWHPASNARDLVDYARKRESKGLIQITLIEEHT